MVSVGAGAGVGVLEGVAAGGLVSVGVDVDVPICATPMTDVGFCLPTSDGATVGTGIGVSSGGGPNRVAV